MTRRESIVAWVGTVMVAVAVIGTVNGPPRVQGQTKGTPMATTGVPAPMLYDYGDPIALGYPCEASRTGIPFYNMFPGTLRPIWICNGSAWSQAAPVISGTTVSIGGAIIALGGSVIGTGQVPGATVGSNCVATPSDGSFLPAGIVIDCAVLTPGVATVRLSAVLVGTPPAKTYNVRVTL
jgi:hypothetical protein